MVLLLLLLQPATNAVSQLKALGVRLVIVAVGNKVNVGSLRQLVQADEDVVQASSFDALLTKLTSVLQRLCVRTSE